MAKKSYAHTIAHTIAGIPCLIGIIAYSAYAGVGRMADSDWDCYGYTEREYEVLDRKGYKANWLEAKLTDKEQANLNTAIDEYMTK